MDKRKSVVLLVTEEQFSKVAFPMMGYHTLESRGLSQVMINHSNAFRTWTSNEVVPIYRLISTSDETKQMWGRQNQIPVEATAVDHELEPLLARLKDLVAPPPAAISSEYRDDGTVATTYEDGRVEVKDTLLKQVKAAGVSEWKYGRVLNTPSDGACEALMAVLRNDCVGAMENFGSEDFQCEESYEHLPNAATRGLLEKEDDKVAFAKYCAVACSRKEIPDRAQFDKEACGL